jgi:hypothetical protein
MFSLLLAVLVKVCSIKVEPTSVPLWTEEELESFVSLWLVILSAWIKTPMFLLYHSEGWNICEMILHECYVNDLRTTTCSGMLGHHKTPLVNCGPRSNFLYIAILFYFYSHCLLSCILLSYYHSIRSILCLQQTSEIDNLIVSWEQSFLLCCVHVSRCCWWKATRRQAVYLAPLSRVSRS